MSTPPRSIIVVKRSMRSGFAGVDNELFYLDKTQMLFGDAKDVIGGVVEELSKLPAREGVGGMNMTDRGSRTRSTHG